MLYFQQTDEILVALTLAGDQSAYDALVERYQKNVLSAAYSVTSNIHMAEDAAQDAFVTAWMKLELLRDPSSFCSWVCRIAQNCGKNMVVRFKKYACYELIDSLDAGQDIINEYIETSSEKESLHESLDNLPEKVQQVISLYYFSGLSVSEIALKLDVPEGTVKWQLHSGRKKLRKDMGAQNEELDDSFVKKVMKKVAELNEWGYKYDKTGITPLYKNILADAETLPESKDKNHILADVLIRGWQWIPDERTETTVSRIKETSLYGKNEMGIFFALSKELETIPEDEQLEYMKNTQIPYLEQKGFTVARGLLWTRVGYYSFRRGRDTEGFDAYGKALTLLSPSNAYYSMVLSCLKAEKLRLSRFFDRDDSHYCIMSRGEHYKIIDGILRAGDAGGIAFGTFYHYVRYNNIWGAASLFEGRFIVDGAKVGDTFQRESDSLTFVSDRAEAETPAGVFKDCQVWRFTLSWRPPDNSYTVTTWYKPGVGIVKQENRGTVTCVTSLLKEYEINGGSGLIPCAVGNRWVYSVREDGSIRNESFYEMVYADRKRVNVSSCFVCERLENYPDNWSDTLIQTRADFCHWDHALKKNIYSDVSSRISRLKELAKTPYEKLHTDMFCAVLGRYISTDKQLNPSRTHTGYANCFCHTFVHRKSGSIALELNRRYSFVETKCGEAAVKNMIFQNKPYYILQFIMGCVWDDRWAVEGKFRSERYYEGLHIVVDAEVTAIGRVNTPAGEFDDCICLSIAVNGLRNGFKGKKQYIFAHGIGIVRTVSYIDEEKSVTYDLVSYEGRGKGYMPMDDGMKRRYEAMDLPEGYEAWGEYVYVEPPQGGLVILGECGGLKKIDGKSGDAQ